MTPKNRENPSKEMWYAIAALVGIGIAAKLGVIYCSSKMRKAR
jgi:LPS O-antigen subunit length determinant protein (WzzB/FepE family)